MRKRIVQANSMVVGLDLSLTGTGVCALPFHWDLDCDRAKTALYGYKLKADSSSMERLERGVVIAESVLAFCRKNHVTHVGIEDHAFGRANTAMESHTKEMTGIVKYLLLKDGLKPMPYHSTTVRKTLLQKVVRDQKVKPWVMRNLARLGPPVTEWSEDVCDAFVVANHTLMVNGGTAMSYESED